MLIGGYLNPLANRWTCQSTDAFLSSLPLIVRSLPIDHPECLNHCQYDFLHCNTLAYMLDMHAPHCAHKVRSVGNMVWQRASPSWLQPARDTSIALFRVIMTDTVAYTWCDCIGRIALCVYILKNMQAQVNRGQQHPPIADLDYLPKWGMSHQIYPH